MLSTRQLSSVAPSGYLFYIFISCKSHVFFNGRCAKEENIKCASKKLDHLKKKEAGLDDKNPIQNYNTEKYIYNNKP